jgi:hypothetical protein
VGDHAGILGAMVFVIILFCFMDGVCDIVDSDFHTFGGFGGRERKGVGLPLMWGGGKAEGLYVGHLSAREGNRTGKAVGDGQQQVSLVLGSHPADGCGGVEGRLGNGLGAEFF